MAKKSLSGHDFRAPILINGDAGTSGQVLISQGNSSIPAWTNSVSGGFTTSDTPPPNPSAGNVWFDTTIGASFIYYDSYWIEIGYNSSVAEAPSGEVTQNIRNVSGSTSLVSNDKNQMIRFTGSSSQVLTVDDVLVSGSKTTVFQDGSGSVTFSPGSGATLLSPAAFSTRAQYSKVEVTCVDSGQYRLSGDLTPKIVSVSGGTLSSDSTYYYRTFTSNGTLQVVDGTLNVEYLVVAGGGGGGTDIDVGGGGGGGGLLTGAATLSSQPYTIIVGAGGSRGTGVDNTGTGGGSNGTQGGGSSFNGFSAIGGGYGGTRGQSGGSGGSGGGGGDDANLGGAGTSGQGYAGGNGPGMNSNGGNDSGGGGGAGGAASLNIPGLGLLNSIGNATFAKGGKGAQISGLANGAANTGDGGSGARSGGSGIVVVRYTKASVGG